MGIEGINEQHSALPVDPKSDSQQSARPHPDVQPSGNTDSVRFSDQTRKFIRVRQLADALPEVRQNRIDQLRKQIEHGTYNVSGEHIAEAILRESHIDLTAE